MKGYKHANSTEPAKRRRRRGPRPCRGRLRRSGRLRDRADFICLGIVPSGRAILRGRHPLARPPDPLERTVAAGLEPAPKEHRTNHVHAHLDVFVDGQAIVVPAGIGINIDDPDVRTFDEPDGSVSYGGIELCAKPCISPLHTHFATGIIHTESASSEPNALGEFFSEWGVALSDSCVGEYCSPKPIAFYVNGEPHTGDPSTIELTDHKEIAIVIGTPPPQIPSTADFSKE
jgi:hypothetical protein